MSQAHSRPEQANENVPAFSALHALYQRFADVSEPDAHALAAGLGAPVDVPPGTLACEAGKPVGRLAVVESGAMAECIDDAEGRRQIVRVLFAGDVAGAGDVAARRHGCDALALTRCRLRPIDPGCLIDPSTPQLAALFWALLLAEQRIVQDRLHRMGRARASERVLHLMLGIAARQRLVAGLPDPIDAEWDEVSIGGGSDADGGEPHGADTLTAWLPLTQSEFGDMAGLTNVYVSKVLTQLRRSGTITVTPRGVVIHDAARQVERCEFVDRYAEIDLGRLGGAPARAARPLDAVIPRAASA